MSRRLRTLAVVALAAAGGLTWASRPRLTADAFRAEVEHHLPPGTPRAEAAEWLRAKGYIANDLVPGCCSFGESVHVREFDTSRLPLLFPRRLRFEIEFDEQGRRVDRLDVAELTGSR